MVIGNDGNCPDCNEKTVIVRRGTKNVGDDIILLYHTFCLKCQKKVKEGEVKVEVDKYGRTKVEL